MNSWQHLTIAAYKSLLEDGPVQMVDIRDTASYQAGHIPGSQAINDDTLGEFLSLANKTTALVVCCYHGNSSQNAADFFVEQGFEDVYSLDGGYAAWVAQDQ